MSIRLTAGSLVNLLKATALVAAVVIGLVVSTSIVQDVPASAPTWTTECLCQWDAEGNLIAFGRLCVSDGDKECLTCPPCGDDDEDDSDS